MKKIFTLQTVTKKKKDAIAILVIVKTDFKEKVKGDTSSWYKGMSTGK